MQSISQSIDAKQYRSKKWRLDVKLATLFRSATLQAHVAAACAAADVEVVTFCSFLALLRALRTQELDGICMEDIGAESLEWLMALKLRPHQRVPIALYGRGGVELISDALLQGASEYATRDEGPHALVQRLLARIQCARRQQVVTRLTLSHYTLDATTRALIIGQACKALTEIEFRLAWQLFRYPGAIVTSQALANEVWGRDSDTCKRTLEQHIYRLRRKLQDSRLGPQGRCQIQSVYAVGYRLYVSHELAQH